MRDNTTGGPENSSRPLPAAREFAHKFTLLLFDLDDTLLRSDKTVSPRNLETLGRIREAGTAGIGICTSRSEKNAAPFIEALRPDVLITSAGARVRAGERTVYAAPFTPQEIGCIVEKAREIAGNDVLMDADTAETHYRNYPATEHTNAAGFEECVETDFSVPPAGALMMCVKLPEPGQAERLRSALPFADVERFVNFHWHKIAKKGVTKATGIRRLCEAIRVSPENIMAFGDDLADVEMLKMAGLGVAVGNALPEVKAAAGAVIGGNDTDAIAEFLERYYFCE